MRLLIIFVIILTAVIGTLGQAHAYTAYTVQARTSLRGAPSLDAEVIYHIDQNRTLEILSQPRAEWFEVRDITGVEGFVHASNIADVRLRIYKSEQILELVVRDTVARQYPVSAARTEAIANLPEGCFFVCSKVTSGGDAAGEGGEEATLLVSYPSAKAARDGLARNLIDHATYKRIVLALKNGLLPPQDTPLGTALHIKSGTPEAAPGSVVMKEHDAEELFAAVPNKARVEIHPSRAQARRQSLIFLPALASSGSMVRLAVGASTP